MQRISLFKSLKTNIKTVHSWTFLDVLGSVGICDSGGLRLRHLKWL